MLSQSEVNELRRDFPALQQRHPRNGRPPVYFDNSCVTLTPRPVAQSVWDYSTKYPGCGGHRSGHWFSAMTQEKVECSRRSLAAFLGIPAIRKSGGEDIPPVIFTRNTSEGLNLVANSFGLLEGETVVITNKEHNSNLCPWQEFERRGGRLRIVFVRQDNSFDLEAFAALLRDDSSIKLVSLHHASNLDGMTTPLREIVAAVRKAEVMRGQSIYICVDGAQAAPHIPVNLGYPDRPDHLDVDFYAGSLHKMLGPSGVGFLYVRPECLDCLRPFLVGGSTIFETSVYHRPIYAEWPERFEAGLQNYAGLHGAGAAVEYLGPLIGRAKPYEQFLNGALTDLIGPLHREGLIRILGPFDPARRNGVLTFIVPEGADGPRVQRFTADAAEWNIMYRTGQFCVDSWFSTRENDLPPAFTAIRFSMYLYNTIKEVELIGGLLNSVFGAGDGTWLH